MGAKELVRKRTIKQTISTEEVKHFTYYYQINTPDRQLKMVVFGWKLKNKNKRNRKKKYSRIN